MRSTIGPRSICGRLAAGRVIERLEIKPVDGPIRGSIRPPGSKSITNRALVCAALADGVSTLTGALDSEDTRVMIESLGRLGFTSRAIASGRRCACMAAAARFRRRRRICLSPTAARRCGFSRRWSRWARTISARRHAADARAADPGPARRACTTWRRGDERDGQRLPAGRRRSAAACAAGEQASAATCRASSSAAC